MSFEFPTAAPRLPAPAPLPTPTPAPARVSTTTEEAPSALRSFLASEQPDGTTDYLGGFVNFGPDGPAGCGSDNTGLVPDKLFGIPLRRPCDRHDADWANDRSYDGMLEANRRLSEGIIHEASDGLLPRRLLGDLTGAAYEAAVDAETIRQHADGPLDFVQKAGGQLVEDTVRFGASVLRDVAESARRTAVDIRNWFD